MMLPLSLALFMPISTLTRLSSPSPCSVMPVCASMIEALEILLQDEVHDAGDGVGAVHRRGAAGDDFHALDRRGGDRVDVDDEQGVGGLRAAAVDQHEIAIGAEAAQVQRRGAGCLTGACLRAGDELVVAGNELRKLLQHRFDRSRGRLFERIGRHGDDRDWLRKDRAWQCAIPLP